VHEALATRFLRELERRASRDQADRYRRAFQYAEDDEFLGVPMGQVFAHKPRDVLYEPARSANVWERRTAIVSTDVFIRRGELDDTFRIGELLLRDPHDLIHKAVGGWLRAAGAKDRARLLRFLDEHASAMPRTALRYAIEHLDPDQRAHTVA
jgi:3-methyladenine DNA glycosylase AlkD